MLHSVTRLKGYAIRATDGDIGSIEDFYFNDADWYIRYIVVNTGTWLAGRGVLLSPSVAGTPDAATRTLSVALTKERVKNSPHMDTDKPISRRMEQELWQHYGWDPYWGPSALIPGSEMAPPPPPAMATVVAPETTPPITEGKSNLRSANEVMGYHMQATDTEAGHVEDFLTDESWAIRYMVVDTRNVLPGKKVLVAPQWIDRIRWADRKTYVNLEGNALKTSPEFDYDKPVSREYEQILHRHYGRLGYWDE